MTDKILIIRACIGCDLVYRGPLICPNCGEPGEPLTGGRGRPAIPEELRRSQWLRLRCTVAELDAYRDAAERAGVTLSEWTRVTLGAASDAGAASPSEFSQD